MTKTIYGLFHKRTGKCLYVGCTGNTKTRLARHRCNATAGGNFHFKVLRLVEANKASLAEKVAIKKYKRNGEAKHNKRIPRVNRLVSCTITRSGKCLCDQCGHKWQIRVASPVSCPYCKSYLNPKRKAAK